MDLTVRIDAGCRLRRPVRGEGRARRSRAPTGRGSRTAGWCSDTSASSSTGRPTISASGAGGGRRARARVRRPDRADGEWSVDIDVATAIVVRRRAPDAREVRRREDARAPGHGEGLEQWLERRAHGWSATGIRSSDLHAQPGRPGGAAVLAAERRRAAPARGRAAVVHDDVRPRQHLHEPAGAAVRARAGRHHAARAGRAAGARVDDFRDEDPGKILHELRYGELTAFEERPHSPYYGTRRRDPLFLVLLDEYERWTGDRKLVRELELEARAALRWIDDYGDLHGQRLRLVPAPQRADRPREPVLEGLVGLDLLPRRHAARVPAGDLRAAGLRLRRQGARRAPRAAGLERSGARRRARDAGGRSQAPVQPRLLGRGRRVLRARARPDGNQVDALTSNIGHLLWSGIVDEVEGQGGRRAT